MSKLKLVDVNKYYGEGISRVHVLKDVNFSAKAGELNLILGPSGSGRVLFNNCGRLTNTYLRKSVD